MCCDWNTNDKVGGGGGQRRKEPNGGVLGTTILVIEEKTGREGSAKIEKLRILRRYRLPSPRWWSVASYVRPNSNLRGPYVCYGL